MEYYVAITKNEALLTLEVVLNVMFSEINRLQNIVVRVCL